MEGHFLEAEMEGEPGFVPRPWYNRHGDCIVFKAEDVGVVAERVDDILTLYYSAEDRSPVGFQIKGVRHLMHKLRCNTVQASGESSTRGQVRIELAFLLMTAYDARPPTIARREGYARAQAVTCPPERALITLDEALPV